MLAIDFSRLFDTYIGYVLVQFNLFFNILSQTKIFGVSVIWWGITVIIISVIFQILFVRFSGDD